MLGLVRWLSEALLGDEPWESYMYWGKRPPEPQKQFDEGELEQRIRGYVQDALPKSLWDTKARHDEHKSLEALRALEEATGTKTGVYFVRQVYQDESRQANPYERFDIHETDIAGLEKSLKTRPREDARFARYVVYAFTPKDEEWANRYFDENEESNTWKKSYEGGAARYERTWLVREARKPRAAAAYAQSTA